MDYTHLGRSGLSVSRLCLGTMNFGPETSEEDSHAIMDRALELGINFFDTANVYGWKKGEGVTEQIVGRWFAQGGGRREKTVIATKLYGSMSDWPNDTFLSARNIRHACDASLKRLQTDYIDLYQMHHVDRATPWEEIWEAMEILRQQGKVLYVGSSNLRRLAHRQGHGGSRGASALPAWSASSPSTTCSTRDVELEVLPACQDYGLGVIPWSPLHGGLLGGHHPQDRAGQAPPDRVAPKDGSKSTARRSRPTRSSATSSASSPPTSGSPGCSPSRRSPRRSSGRARWSSSTASMRALKVRLTKDVLAQLDEIFPGPGGAAPEAYAW